MLYYTNILTLYNQTPEQTTDIAGRIAALGVPVELLENTFFFGTGDPQDSRDFESTLSALPLQYTFLFLFNPDASFIKTRGIAPVVAGKLEDILHNDF